MRSFAWVLVLIALFVALPVSAQTTVITLRAPFDGVVDLLPSMGEQKPQTPPALYSFNALRSEANKKGAKLNLRKLPPPPPAAAVANVVTLTSDVLDLQIIQDDALLAAAATRLKGAKDSLALEQNLSPEVEGARDADEVAGHMSVEAAYQNYLNHPLKADDDARYRDNANAARAHNFTVSKGRRQAQLAELTL